MHAETTSEAAIREEQRAEAGMPSEAYEQKDFQVLARRLWTVAPWSYSMSCERVAPRRVILTAYVKQVPGGTCVASGPDA